LSENANLGPSLDRIPPGGHMADMNAPEAPTPGWRGTTILAVKKGERTVIAGDGQVSMGATIVKANAR
jgi:ATP-dependent HslUV protease subunit HslV